MGALVETQINLPGIPAPRPALMAADYLEIAIKQGAAPEVLQKFMDLVDREQARQAKLAFTQAKAQFAAEEIRISKDKVNKQYGSNYTSIGNMVNTVRPYLGQHGFDIRWEIEQGEEITVTCVLTHEFGHSEKAFITVPPDISGQKNPLQQVKSAITYARILTFEAVCGLASQDGMVNVDDDANSAYTRQQTQAKAIPEGGGIPDERFVELEDWIKNAKDKADLDKFYKLAMQEAHSKEDSDAQHKFAKAKNEWLKGNHAR